MILMSSLCADLSTVPEDTLQGSVPDGCIDIIDCIDCSSSFLSHSALSTGGVAIVISGPDSEVKTDGEICAGAGTAGSWPGS